MEIGIFREAMDDVITGNDEATAPQNNSLVLNLLLQRQAPPRVAHIGSSTQFFYGEPVFDFEELAADVPHSDDIRFGVGLSDEAAGRCSGFDAQTAIEGAKHEGVVHAGGRTVERSSNLVLH